MIASLHSGLKQPRAQVMERIMCAIDNRHVDMIAHPTGRLVGRRDGADLDMTRVIFANNGNSLPGRGTLAPAMVIIRLTPA